MNCYNKHCGEFDTGQSYNCWMNEHMEECPNYQDLRTFTVNADLTINVSTIVDSNEIGHHDDETIRKQAISQILDGDYDIGDPVKDPEINWIEENKDRQQQ